MTMRSKRIVTRAGNFDRLHPRVRAAYTHPPVLTMKNLLLVFAAAILIPVSLFSQSNAPRVTRELDGTLRMLDEPVVSTAGGASAASFAADGDEQWDARFNPLEAALGTVSVSAIAVTPTRIYVGGNFNEIEAEQANFIMMYERGLRYWHQIVERGINGVNGPVTAIVADGEDVYVAGQFDKAGPVAARNVARYDGSQWHAIDAQLPQDAYPSALAMYDGHLYLSGRFGSTGNVALYRLDGSAWTPMGIDGSYSSRLMVYDGELIMGGFFLRAGDSLRGGALGWNGQRWRALVQSSSSGFDLVRDFAIAPSGELYASGNFDADSLGDVVRYDGSAWRPVGGAGVRRKAFGLQASVNAIAVAPNGDLYAAGSSIDSAGSVKVIDMARWNGSEWSSVGNVYYGVSDLAFVEDTLLVAGTFTRVDAVRAYGLARRVDGAWSSWGNAYRPGGTVYSMERAPNGDIYVGGNFQLAGGIGVNNIARWDGSAWHALGTGVNGDAKALFVDATGAVHVGGWMSAVTHAGSEHVENLAVWRDSAWAPHPVPFRSASQLFDIAANSTGLYVAGGIVLDTNIQWPLVRFDGVRWRPVGDSVTGGVQGTAWTLLADGNDMYVGGQFAAAGDVAVGSVARWNAGGWSRIGSDGDPAPTGLVTALAKWRGSLMVAAGYSTDVPRAIGRYDLATGAWISIPPLFGMVNAMTPVGDDLYVTGYLELDGSKNVARFDGTSFSGLGSGLDDGGNAIVADNAGRLYVGGAFTTAGGKPSYGVARWNGVTLAVDAARAPHRLRAVAAPNAFAGTSTLEFTLEHAARVRITLVDERGRAVANLAEAQLDAGDHTMTIDATTLAAGAYYLHMSVDAESSVVPIRITH
jgi:trimeric autotransporter adhesin